MPLLLYTAMQVIGLLLVAALAFSMFLIPWIMVRQQKIRPAEISPDSARRHFALILLIRGPEILIGNLLFLGMGLIGLGFFLQINPFHHPQFFGPFFSVSMLIIILLVGAFVLARMIHRFPELIRSMFLRFSYVTTNSVSNFAFIFAAFAAHDLYHFLPPSKLATRRESETLAGQFLDRDLLWIIVFWVVWFSTKHLLLRLLELNTRRPPQYPPQADEPPPDAPEFPQKSPLVQL